MSDRKYGQRGYMEGDRKSHSKPEPAQRKAETFGPRAINMPGKHSISRCAECGAILPAMADVSSGCSKCGAALHCCKQCAHFDPAARFECLQQVPVRIARKNAANDCEMFSLKVTVERETSTGATRSGDARQAFEDLFKKL